MISKNNRQNHNFQIFYFLMGSCHTPDAKYAILLDLKQDRVNAIEAYEVELIRQKAKRIKIEKSLKSKNEVIRLNAEADLLELNNRERSGQVLYLAALDELSFINKCMEDIQPFRKYKHLSDSEAVQAMQQEEWALELVHRAENFLATTRTIPADHFATMRMHPDFNTFILPEITRIKLTCENNSQNVIE